MVEKRLLCPNRRRRTTSLRLELPVAVASAHHPLARHAQHRFLVGQGAEPHGRNPRERMGFVADPESVVLGLHEEAYVEVQVGRLAATGRNPVHVDVEDDVVERPHVESGYPRSAVAAKTWSVKPPVSAYCSRTRRPASLRSVSRRSSSRSEPALPC